MCNRNHQLDVSHTLTAHFLLSYLYTATLAHNTFVTNTFVLTAMALIVLGRTEDALAEQTITLRFVGTIVDGLRFENLSRAKAHNLIWRCESDGDAGETVFLIILFKSHNS